MYYDQIEQLKHSFALNWIHREQLENQFHMKELELNSIQTLIQKLIIMHSLDYKEVL